jgi:hypothetical protein
MIRRLLGFALGQRIGTLALALLSRAVGVWVWIELKKEAYPDVGDTRVVVIAQFPRRGAEEVERLLQVPGQTTAGSLQWRDGRWSVHLQVTNIVRPAIHLVMMQWSLALLFNGGSPIYVGIACSPGFRRIGTAARALRSAMKTFP